MSNCPICGEPGFQLFNGFFCDNPDCKNYEESSRGKGEITKESKIPDVITPADIDEEDWFDSSFPTSTQGKPVIKVLPNGKKTPFLLGNEWPRACKRGKGAGNEY